MCRHFSSGSSRCTVARRASHTRVVRMCVPSGRERVLFLPCCMLAARCERATRRRPHRPSRGQPRGAVRNAQLSTPDDTYWKTHSPTLFTTANEGIPYSPMCYELFMMLDGSLSSPTHRPSGCKNACKNGPIRKTKSSQGYGGSLHIFQITQVTAPPRRPRPPAHAPCAHGPCPPLPIAPTYTN